MSSDTDTRSAQRRKLDEQIAAEPPLAPLHLPADAKTSPVEKHLSHSSAKPLAVAGVVENGLVRPLDPAVILPEHARVIIVTAGAK